MGTFDMMCVEHSLFNANIRPAQVLIGERDLHSVYFKDIACSSCMKLEKMMVALVVMQ